MVLGTGVEKGKLRMWDHIPVTVWSTRGSSEQRGDQGQGLVCH
jgi:hypothetical protein